MANGLPVSVVAVPLLPEFLIRRLVSQYHCVELMQAEGQEEQGEEEAPNGDGCENDNLIVNILRHGIQFRNLEREKATREEGMDASEDEEVDEIDSIASTNACADPGAMMVMHLHAEATCLAVISSRWPL